MTEQQKEEGKTVYIIVHLCILYNIHGILLPLIHTVNRHYYDYVIHINKQIFFLIIFSNYSHELDA